MIRHPIVQLILLASISLPSAPGRAQELEADATYSASETEVVPDVYSKRTEKRLLLRGEDRTSLPAEAMQSLVSKLDLLRFDLQRGGADPNGAEVAEWCRQAAEETQRIRDQVDANGDPIVTLAVLMERCADVFRLTLDVGHRCESARDRKGRLVARCRVEAQGTFERFEPEAAEEPLRFAPAAEFGTSGRCTAQTARTASTRVTEGMAEARRSATEAAAGSAGKMLWFEILNRCDLAIRTPVNRNEGGVTYACMSRDLVGLDQPFLVVEPGSERVVGYVKARNVYDGCTLTEKLRKKTERGEEVEIRDMESQNILGGGDIRAGMNMKELPTVGLSVGGHAGVAPIFGQVAAPTFGLRGEQSIARLTGISELYLAGVARLTIGDPDPLVFGSTAGVLIQVDVGALKRWYIAGPLFADLAAYLAGTFATDSDSIRNLGVAGTGAIGFQITPRWTGKVTAGGRAAGYLGSFSGAAEAGLLTSLDVLYTF